jgi:O-antigen/teichoic acid export membrane protein
MVLMLFMARYMSFADIGAFSLMVGSTALLPGAVGLGLSYFVNRDIVDGAGTAAHLLARDRLIVTFGCGVASALGIAVLSRLEFLHLAVDLQALGAIIVLEMIGFDLQLLLIARHRAALANLLLFLRTAAWVPFFMLLAYIDPASRDIDVLLKAWLVGEIAAAVAAAWALRHLLQRSLLVRPFDFAWLRCQFPRVLPIWLSDFSLAVGQNIDRFVISLTIGVAATGIYFFFFSIGSAAFQIVQSATIQPFMPRMREAFRAGIASDFHRVVTISLNRVVTFATIIIFCAGIGNFFLVIILHRPELYSSAYLIMPIMLGMLAKSINECLGIVDYVTENDVRYISLNVAALGVTAILLAPGAWLFGLAGAAGAFLLTMTLFASLRWRIWHRGPSVAAIKGDRNA